MAGTAAPKPPETNRVGLQKKDYAGSKSTLCIGCGHDLITARIIDACYDLDIKPEQFVKLSGIGCSSKTPAYFVSRSFSFNSVHGRMPSIATGTALANRSLRMIGVSGDGDTANIGIGQFAHVMRRNLDLVYVVENNGVYGLTKGQFSATADKGSKLKHGAVNHMHAIDLCALAVELGCGFVARLFAGNTKMMRQVMQAAMAYEGLALLDIVSPCVTFNNHAGSTKSFPYAKDNEFALQDIGFVPAYDPQYEEMDHGDEREITLGDGSHITIKALEKDYDPTNRIAALNLLAEYHESGKIPTGIIYINEAEPRFVDQINMCDTPLSRLKEDVARPSKAALDEVMDELA
ncbi:MAG: 2-oxoacid:ferredoxin oxidoreductase subunit beta [Planctomycetes bacterium]|nr:2-oxoacid:ferredoxin oxidoreductase subunit beta [Planctomycetota bacterium]